MWYKHLVDCSVQSLGLELSTVNGDTILGGVTSPALPIHSIDPLLRRSLIVEFMKSINCAQLFEFLKIRGGG